MKIIRLLSKKLSLYFALAGIVAGIFLVKKINRPDPVPQPLALPVANPFDEAIAASGIVEALDRNLLVGTPVSGIVKAVWIKSGNIVQKGDRLFQIDGRDLEAELLVQQANLEVADAQLQRVQDQLERLESVQDVRAISRDELKTRQHDLRVAAAQSRAAACAVQQTQILLDRLLICAPKEGMVLQCNVREGEYLSSDTSTAPVLLGDLRQLQVRADIDEQNAARFQAGQAAYAYPKNCPSLKIPLKFSRIEPYVIPKRSLTGSGDERVDTRVLQVLYSFECPKDYPIYVGQQLDIFIDALGSAMAEMTSP